MEIDNLLTVTTQHELLNWLDQNATTQTACWVIVSVKPEPGKLLYLDAVEAALCYGWIDGIKKKISPNQTAQRLSPRAKRSSWTELNKARVRRLEKLGLMTDQGRAVLPDMDVTHFKIDAIILEAIRVVEARKRYFDELPDLYKRIKIDNIQSVQADVYQKRLDKFLKSLDAQERYGQWHDNGRLL